MVKLLSKRVAYLGFNNLFKHKRGVENVIDFQSRASLSLVNYYIHWDNKTSIYHHGNLICIGIKKNFFWSISLNLVLFKIKNKNKYIFIHSHNPLMSIGCIYQSNLFTVHDGLYYLTKVKKHKLNKIFYLLEKILYTRTNFVHFISNYTKKMSLFPNGNIKYIIIPNTSHFESFISKNNCQNNAIKDFNINTTKVFTIRSIEERALINLIIDVAEKLNSKNIEFLVAGKGPLLNYYREKINKKGLENITLLGYVPDDDLVQYYKDCDLVLMPAAYGEGFGLPIIEGYLFNKPVISSNVCAIPEVIVSDDFLFDNSAESIISKIHFAIEQIDIQYSDFYFERYSNKVVISKMNELYKKLF